MELTTRRETLYERMGRGKHHEYFVYLKGERIANGKTKEEAQAKAKQVLSDAYNYATRSAEVRVAGDGSVIVFRQLSADTAMYEFCRNGNAGGSSCMGKMSNGVVTFGSLKEFADYVVGQYNS